MKRLSVLIVLVVVACLFMGGNTVVAKETPQVKVKSEITEVTVFVLGARVYRHAEVVLKQGEQQIVFEGYSTSLIDDSVRVLFDGVPKARISGIDIQTESTFRLIEAENEVLGDKSLALSDQMKMLDSEKAGYKAEIDFANSVISQIRNSENLTQDVTKLKETMTFVRDTIKNANDEINKIDMKIRDVRADITEVQKQIRDLKQKYPSHQKNLIVRLTAPVEEKVDMIISYITPEACWQPSYDVRYVEEKKKVEIISYGEITQNTGENWDNVKLTLSTAEATGTVALPKFMPSVVHMGDYEVEESEANYEAIERQFLRFNAVNSQNIAQSNIIRLRGNSKGIDSGIAWEPEEPNSWEAQSRSYFTGKLSRLLGTIVFELDEKRSINGDSRPHRTMLSLNEFDAEMDYFARPAISEFVYNHATLKNTSKTPLLEGEMNIFVDSKFVGKWDMEPVAPGDEFEVYFGTVNELKINREVVKLLREGPDPKSYRSSNLLTREMKITVENFLDKDVEVKILDSIPLSWSDEVKVKLPVISPKVEPDKLGRLFWTLKIKPEKESVIEYTYVIEYPEEEEVELEKWTEERYEEQREFYEKNKK